MTQHDAVSGKSNLYLDDNHELVGATVYSSGSYEVGKVSSIIVDDALGRPAWALVKTGLLGPEVHVPLQQAQFHDGGVYLPYEPDQIKNAPRFAKGQQFDEAAQAEASAYFEGYGLLPGERFDANLQHDRPASQRAADQVREPIIDQSGARQPDPKQLLADRDPAGHTERKAAVVADDVLPEPGEPGSGQTGPRTT